MSEKENNRQNVYDMLNAETLYKTKIFFFTEMELLKGKWRIEQKFCNEGFLTGFATAIRNNPSTSIREHPNELKVHEKTARTAIKQDSSQGLNLLGYAT